MTLYRPQTSVLTHDLNVQKGASLSLSICDNASEETIQENMRSSHKGVFFAELSVYLEDGNVLCQSSNRKPLNILGKENCLKEWSLDHGKKSRNSIPSKEATMAMGGDQESG